MNNIHMHINNLFIVGVVIVLFESADVLLAMMR